MVNASLAGEVIAPRMIILPQQTTIAGTNVPTGTLVVSGGNLVLYDGTNWKLFSGSNVA